MNDFDGIVLNYFFAIQKNIMGDNIKYCYFSLENVGREFKYGDQVV